MNGKQWTPGGGGGGGGTPTYGLYGDVPLNRVWFLPLSLEQGLQISVSVWNRVWFCHATLEHGRGYSTFLLPESRS